MDRSRSNIVFLLALWLFVGVQGLAAVPNAVSFEEDQGFELKEDPTPGPTALEETYLLKLNPGFGNKFQISAFATLPVQPSTGDRKYGRVRPDGFLVRDKKAFLSIHIFPFHVFW